MIPNPISNRTRAMCSPKEWDVETHGECATLDIVDQGGWMISLWTPTPEELERIKAGKPIQLNIFGRQHPVVSVGVME